MNCNNNLRKWFAFYTKSKHEKLVCGNLTKQSYEVYLPLLREKKKWSDRKVWVQYPLFKSYIFVKIEPKFEMSILKTPGIVKMIKFGNKPSPISEETIYALKLMINGGYKPHSTESFIKGDPVIVKDGPLKGLKGEIATIQNEEHFIIHLDAIQQTISLKIKRAFLSKL